MADARAPPAVLAGCIALGVGVGFALWRCTTAAERETIAAPQAPEASKQPSDPKAQKAAQPAKAAKVAPPAPVEDEFDVEVEAQQVELFEDCLASLSDSAGENMRRLPELLKGYKKVLEDGLPGRGKEFRAASAALEAALVALEDEDNLYASQTRLGQEPDVFRELAEALTALLGGPTETSCPPGGCQSCTGSSSCGSKAEAPAVEVSSGGAVKLDTA